MPDVRLTRAEEDGNLPQVCMCCGAPATAWVERNFLAHDPAVRGPSVFWEVFAIRLLIAAANTPRVRLRTSFCPRHRHYWHLRAALAFGGLAGMLAVLFIGLLGTILLIAVAKVDAPWLSCCAIVPFLAYIVPWIIAIKLVQDRTIRARLGKGDAIILQNVSERYVTALEEQRNHAAALTQAAAGEPPVVLLVDTPPEER